MLTWCALLRQVGALKQEISELDTKMQEADRLLKVTSQLALHRSLQMHLHIWMYTLAACGRCLCSCSHALAVGDLRCLLFALQHNQLLCMLQLLFHM